MKKLIYSILIICIIFSSGAVKAQPGAVKAQQEVKKEYPELQKYFDEYGVKGSFLLYDQANKQWISHNDARNKQGFLPASTFKILNSLIAYETGLVADTSAVLKWDGRKRWNENWNRDLTVKEAFAVSCVPCYQELARKAGLARMKQYVEQSKYGNMDITAQTLDYFWLMGNSRITPYEQIDFLRSLQAGKLPFKPESMQQLKHIMLRETGASYKIYAKTGLTEQEGQDIGWYVGYVETAGNTYFFALNIEKVSKEKNDKFIAARTEITKNILKQVGVL